MTYLLNGMFDMFKSGTAFWEWLTSASAKTYVIIICVAVALLIAAVIFACCKKARVRKNDVNVLLLLGDDDKSVDAEIFKRNYAMVLVSKNDNTKTAKDREIERPILLTDSTDELTELNEEIVSDVIISDDEEFIIEDTVTDAEVEDIVEEQAEETDVVDDQSEETEVLDEIEETEPITDTLAVVDSEEEIPFNELVDDAEEEEIDELVEEEIDETVDETVEEIDEITDAPVEEIVEEEIEEIVDDADEIEVAEIEEPVEEIAETAEIEEETVEPEIVEIEEETVDTDQADENIIVAPIIINNADNVEVETFANDTEEVKEEEVVKPEVVIYDIDASEDYARDRIEVVNYIRVAGKVTSETSVVDAEEETVAETVSDEVVEEPVAVSEEIFMIETEVAEEESEVAETVAPEVVEIEETIVEPEIVDEEVVEEPEVVAEEVIEEIAEEPVEEITEEVASDVVDESQESVFVIDESEEDKETAAYTIVKEEEAVPEAIEAVQNGEVIVDANGDGIVAEVLVDKNILKARYKTVDLETRLRRADESTKIFYSELKNFLLSYEGVKSRVSKKFDTFTIGRFIVAKMAVRGNVINLYLALASESIENKYFAEDVGDSDTYGKTPTLHKVKSKRGCKYGIELIRDIMNELQIQVNEAYEATDFVAAYPPENIEEKKDAIRYLFKESVSVEELGELSDEDALELIEVVKNKQYTINKFMPINKYVVFVDDLDALYSAGETVTISDLIDKEALPKEENIFLEIRAKGRLNKPLTVEAHSFDPAAIKMIILTDGKVIQYK